MSKFLLYLLERMRSHTRSNVLSKVDSMIEYARYVTWKLSMLYRRIRGSLFTQTTARVAMYSKLPELQAKKNRSRSIAIVANKLEVMLVSNAGKGMMSIDEAWLRDLDTYLHGVNIQGMQVDSRELSKQKNVEVYEL